MAMQKWMVLVGLVAANAAVAGPKRAQKRLMNAAPAVNADDIPLLAGLLDKAGWTATPELSGVFQVGRIFKDDGSGHSLMIRECFAMEAGRDPYTSSEVVSHLEAGVRLGFFAPTTASTRMVRTVRFDTPVHHTLERLAMVPTPECTAMLTQATEAERATMYAVQEVLTAVITEQRCGTLDAKGRFILGVANAEVERSCSQVSQEPVAVAYRSVPVDDLTIGPAAIAETHVQSPVRAVQAVGEPVNEDCHWGDIDRVHSTMTTLTINEQMMDVRGLENRAWIATELQRCGYPDAAEAFNEWRESRRATNIACGTGVGCYAIPVGIWASVQAKKHRLAMERALLSPRVDADEE